MKTIIFVCHGNICRSPAAEFIFKYLLNKYHRENEFKVLSRATSLEEIGNDIYPPMKRELWNNEIPFTTHQAKRITKEDYEQADYIFYMDDLNLSYLNRLIPDTSGKYKKISIYSKNIDFIDDPWYSGDFENVFNQIYECCEDILNSIR